MLYDQTIYMLNRMNDTYDMSNGCMKPYVTNGVRLSGTDTPKVRNKKRIKRAMAKASRKKNRKK